MLGAIKIGTFADDVKKLKSQNSNLDSEIQMLRNEINTDRKEHGKKELKERPLTSRYKGLASVQYKTPKNLFQFDATLAINGPGRMPEPYQMVNGEYSWEKEYKAFPQLNAQITYNIRKNFSVYIGGEVIIDAEYVE